MGIRGRVDLVGHGHYSFSNIDPTKLPPIENIIIKSRSPDQKWIEGVTQSIGDWRAIFRSTYIRWALAINGLHVASESYGKRDDSKNKFTVSSVRFNPQGHIQTQPIAKWDFSFAAEAHRDSTPMLCAWGLMDLCAVLEEFVFKIYRIYLTHNPQPLMRGSDFVEIRRLYRQRNDSPESKTAWDTAWEERITSWQRKRIYDGLGRVFLAFCKTSGIKAPSSFKQTTPETWAETIEGISLVRNCLIHGMDTVNKELEDFCRKPHSIGFSFTAGDPLKIDLIHLQSVEYFTNQLLTALNLSLCEIAGFQLPK